MTKAKERFRFVKEYNNAYKVSSYGYVLSCLNNKYGKSNEWRLKIGTIGTPGYLFINLNHNNKKQAVRIHTLVGIYFIPNPNNYTQLNHKDRNKLNNHADNLEWVSGRENSTHSFITRKKKSRYMGVVWLKIKQRWKSVIVINRKAIHLGSYKTEEEAHLAYLFAMELYGIVNKYATHTSQTQ